MGESLDYYPLGGVAPPAAGMDGIGVVEAVAKQRGCIIKGRRGGKLGHISPETPESRAAMLAVANAGP